jgi:DNA polymerase III alpha subunit
MFVTLHLKSDYSLGYGTSSVDELVEHAAASGYRTLALTDLENLYGQVRFHDRCRQHGIQPITGVELRSGFHGRKNPGIREGRVVLLALDHSGYRSLCRIVSARRCGSSTDACGDPVPTATRHAEGLFALSDDVRVIERLLSSGGYPPDRLGLLLVRPAGGTRKGREDGEATFAEAAGRLGVRLVADLDAVFLQRPDHKLHLLQVAVSQGRLVGQVAHGPDVEGAERWLRSPAEAAALFADLPDALSSAGEIAARCRLDLAAGAESRHIVDVTALGLREGSLREICRSELARRRGEGRVAGSEYDTRLEEELALFDSLGFTGFMLVVSEILAHCREKGIPVAVRGSAVSSLVLNLLGGSPVDPLAQGLLFERFLHAGKSAWPDVDIDLPWHRRDEVIQWVYRRFGDEKVAMVSALHTFRYRSAVREGLKAFGAADPFIDRMLRALPPEELEAEEVGLDFVGVESAPSGDITQMETFPPLPGPPPPGEGTEMENLSVRAGDALGLRAETLRRTKAGEGTRMEQQIPLPGLPAHKEGTEDLLRLRDAHSLREGMTVDEVMVLVRRLVGRPRHLAVHPGGIVIDCHPLADLVPLERAPKGVVTTQYDLLSIAKVGLVKLDLLGNRCLSELEETLTLAGWRKPFTLEAIPAEDPKTLYLIDCADTVGCFQLESPAMRSLLARLPIRRQGDLIAALALIRPGASAGEVKEMFIRRARGEERAENSFSFMSDRLAPTYGLPIYEEDIMLLLSRSGGVTLAEADELRRGIVKSGEDREVLHTLQSGFLQQVARNFPDDRSALARARRAWAVAARFAAYSFNKAHAASYSRLAYYSAYLKAHYPVQFACALLNHHQGLYPLRVEAADFARRGVRFLSPHVNFSAYDSQLETKEGGAVAVRVGLGKVKGMTRRSAAHILSEREKNGSFAELPDLLRRVPLARAELKALILCGGCDGVAPLAAGGYPFVHEAVLEKLEGNTDPAQLLGVRVAPATDAAEDARRKRYQSLVRVRNELNYLEMHLSGHPMVLLREEAERVNCMTIAKAMESAADATVRLAAVVAAMRRTATRQGPMQFVSFEDETGLMEALVFPAQYKRLGERVSTPGPFLVEGRVRREQGAVHLEVTLIKPFHER